MNYRAGLCFGEFFFLMARRRIKQYDTSFYEGRAIWFLAIVPFCLVLLFHFGSCSGTSIPRLENNPANEVAAASVDESSENTSGAKNLEQLAQVPIFTASELAEFFKVSEDELEELVEDFDSSIRLGRLSKPYSRICRRHKESCELLAHYYADGEEKQRLHRARRRERRRTRRTRRYYLKEKDVTWAQKNDFWRHYRRLRLRSADSTIRLMKAALQTSNCPRNLSAALALRGEEFLPNEQITELTEKLLEHARPCISSKDRAQEVLFLRYGLISYRNGKLDLARELLNQALDVADPRERYRVLYWIGRIDVEQNPGKANAAWRKLVSEYPLSYYAIRASKMLNVDPLNNFAPARDATFARNSASKPEMNLAIRWLEALIWYNHQRTATLLVEWMRTQIEGVELPVVHYIAGICSEAGMYRPGIALLRSFYRLYPQQINMLTLRLLYPRPYLDILKDVTKDKIQTPLVVALIRQESAFDYRAVSPARAKGLMQILPRTARRLARRGHRKLFNIEMNTYMGVKYLTRVARRFGNDMELVLAGYNAGPYRVSQWLKRYPIRDNTLLWNEFIPFMETRDYVTSISRNNYWYIRLYGEFGHTDESLLKSRFVAEVL